METPGCITHGDGLNAKVASTAAIGPSAEKGGWRCAKGAAQVGGVPGVPVCSPYVFDRRSGQRHGFQPRSDPPALTGPPPREASPRASFAVIRSLGLTPSSSRSRTRHTEPTPSRRPPSRSCSPVATCRGAQTGTQDRRLRPPILHFLDDTPGRPPGADSRARGRPTGAALQVEEAPTYGARTGSAPPPSTAASGSTAVRALRAGRIVVAPGQAP